MPATPCPCGQLTAGRPLAFAACCGRYLGHFDTTPAPNVLAAPDAAALMRSRYSAFVLDHTDYLLATWHPSQRPATLTLESHIQWLGLQVRSHRVLDDSHAEVEFVARHRDHTGRATRQHERSRFVREGGHWYYLDGDVLP